MNLLPCRDGPTSFLLVAEVCVAWDQKGQDVMKAFNPKLRELTDAIQKWAGKPVPQLRVFDRKQDEWATALSDKQVTLRLGDESVSLKLVGKLKDAPSASVELAKPLAEALKKCVGCVGQECDKVALTWRVEGLNLNFYNANGRNTAPVVTWFAQSPNPGLDWFGACGEARFYIEKL